MKEIQVGKVMLTPKGEYDSTKNYTRLDVVTYQGSSYVCLVDTSTTPPGDSWQLLAEKGATGPAGSPGHDGKDGQPGSPGKDGQPGRDGNPGQDGKDGVTPHIDATTGNWFIGTTNTGVKAQGPAGQPGSDGKPGQDGHDGISPHIDKATGHWFIGTTDTGVSARGPQGQAGKDGAPGCDGKDLTNTVQVITSGTLANLGNKSGFYHYEIDCNPVDSPSDSWGLCDVVVGEHYAKQTYTVAGGSDGGTTYVRVRDWGSSIWSDWRKVTTWS